VRRSYEVRLFVDVERGYGLAPLQWRARAVRVDDPESELTGFGDTPEAALEDLARILD
jgi:hypothetical protein